MGISIESFWLHGVCALLFQVAAVLGFRAGRPYVGWTLQFGAAHGALLAGIRSERFVVLLAAAVLYAPLVSIPARSIGRGARLGVAIGAILAAVSIVPWFIATVDDPATRGRRIVQDRWTSSSPLRQMGQSVVLKPHWRRGRVQDWGSEIRFDWNVPGGAEGVDVVLENAGAADAWRVEEGAAELTGGDRSRLRARLTFPARGGTVRLRRREESGPTRLLVVGGLRGDLAAADRLLEHVRDESLDGIVLLGDMVAPGDYRGLLAMRDRFDAVGTRVAYVPGPAERQDETGWAPLFEGAGGADRLAQIKGVVAVLLDTTSGAVIDEGLTAVSTRRLLGGGGHGLPIAFSERGVAAPAARRGALMPDAGRLVLRDKLREWGVGIAVASVDGDRFDHEHAGLRQLGLGIRDDAVDAVLLTVEDGRLAELRWLTVPRDRRGGFLDWFARLRAGAEEHVELAEVLTYGLAAGLGGLLTLLGLLPRRGGVNA